MDILNYTDFFHDGSIIDIKQESNEILFFMESAEVSGDDLQDDIALTEEQTIKGILHLENPVNIQIDKSNEIKEIKMLADLAGILKFEIVKNKVRFFVEWINYPPRKQIEKFSDIEIEVEKIRWESNLGFFDPFGKNTKEEI